MEPLLKRQPLGPFLNFTQALAHEPLQHIEPGVIDELIVAYVKSIPVEHVCDVELARDIVFLEEGLLDKIAADEGARFDAVVAHERLKRHPFRFVFEHEGENEG